MTAVIGPWRCRLTGPPLCFKRGVTRVGNVGAAAWMADYYDEAARILQGVLEHKGDACRERARSIPDCL
jgi:hypothetical protein